MPLPLTDPFPVFSRPFGAGVRGIIWQNLKLGKQNAGTGILSTVVRPAKARSRASRSERGSVTRGRHLANPSRKTALTSFCHRRAAAHRAPLRGFARAWRVVRIISRTSFSKTAPCEIASPAPARPARKSAGARHLCRFTVRMSGRPVESPAPARTLKRTEVRAPGLRRAFSISGISAFFVVNIPPCFPVFCGSKTTMLPVVFLGNVIRPFGRGSAFASQVS